MKIHYLFVFLFIFRVFFLVGQDQKAENRLLADNLHFHLLDVSTGLSHNFINDIKQDSLGFIWIATIDGLNRYDGSEFLHFKKDFESPDNGLANNYIQQLKIMNSDELLIATDGGLAIYNLVKDDFRMINTEDGLLNNSVSSIGVGPDGKMIIGTYRGGIQFASDNWNFKFPQEKFLHNINLTSNEISSIQLQHDSLLWIGTYNNGLNKINLKDGKVTHLFTKNNSEKPAVINSLYEDNEGNLWIGTRDGLQVITSQNDTIRLGATTSVKTGLSDDDVLCFEEDQCGNMWIGTRNGGLNIISKFSLLDDDPRLELQWYTPRSDGSSVFNRTVSVITMDRDQNMWIGTPTGINYVNPKGEPVRLLRHNKDEKSISHNRIGALAKSNNDKIWIGTDGGGLDLYDPRTGNIDNYSHVEGIKHSLSNNYILSILEDSKKRVWVGTYQGGLNKLDTGTGKSKHYLQGAVSEGSDVRVIYESANGTIWVGTNRGGLYKYIESKDRFNYIATLGKIDIRSIDDDQCGNLWLATFGSGLISFNPDSGEFSNYNKENTKGINSDILFSVLALDGEIFAGTRYGGLLQFNPKSEQVLSFTERDGLSNNTVNSLVQEDSSYIWMGTYNGINRFNLRTNEVLDISSLNNIQAGEFNIGAALRVSSGHLYFGGNNGLNILNPNHFSTLENEYPILFKGLKVLNKPIKIHEKERNAILSKTMLYQDEIKLKHNQNSFSVEFAALKYPAAHNLKYAYKLENYNEYWIEEQEAGVANFTSVPPGEYTLKVMANSGLGAQNIKELKIVVAHPFWRTFPAYLLYFILIGFLIWITFNYYSERLHLKNSLLLEKKQRQLEHDLNEERFRFFTAFSHELKTPLTLILAPVENMLSENQNKKLKNDLLFIQRNAKKLHRSINRLLEFRKAEEGLSQLNKREHNLSGNLKKWVTNYLPLASEKNISLEYSLPADKKIFLIDKEKIEVIVNNLLSNAIKYCRKGGEVKVMLSCYEHEFEISVKDTGTGINKDELLHIFDWYYRSNSNRKKTGTGIGLGLSRRFAELHGGDIKVESTPGEKTIFTLRIPSDQIKGNKKTPVEVEEVVGENDSVFFDRSKSSKQIASFSSRDNKQLILIIDDNEEILSFLSGIFQEEYDVLYSRNGQEGIVKASNYVPDIIISDVMMPEKNGIDLCSELKQQVSTSHIPIILLTAKANLESINLGYEQGADAYIVKPFNSKLLKTRVKNLLSSRVRLHHYFKNGTKEDIEPKEKVSSLLNKEKEFLSELDLIVTKHIGKGTDNVDLISKDIGMSRTSLYRKLKAITGLSINEYIRNLKVERAAGLIKNENFSVSQASYEVGFNNIKYFRKVFKEKYGKTPSEFKS
ncbi:two component regulator with propeller domain [Salegentibacter sp. 24]|uniref:hybrid sensor histidine kinase/response regulator transcription factor n=1 Tax=Salegentibacter sp. 24 TaxID=2183986 RepID=UPI00105F3F0C|nr:hybrid sensor histidine kinase/response regulator transcription factor [Salegentibacter sp. 24]TDN95081.1 two component regulator with propeller domain [Salegentibacter sp. 24]